MTSVNTVLGPIASGELGATLMHEHVFIVSPETLENDPDVFGDEAARIEDAVRRLERVKAAGIDTIVDVTAIGLGRNARRLRRVAERAPVNLVASTGVYAWAVEPHPYRYRGPGRLFDEPDRLVDLFIRDVTIGIAGSGVRAGIIKVATDEFGLTRGVERLLVATAAAQLATGVPITTHTHAASRAGLIQQEILGREGVDLTRVIIGHSGDSTDLAYLEELIANGSTLGMDRFGIEPFLSFDERVGTVVAMCERGLAGRMVLSHDASCFDDGHDQGRLRSLLPNWHWEHVPRDVIPELRRRGVTEAMIHQMLVENPRRLLEPVRPPGSAEEAA